MSSHGGRPPRTKPWPEAERVSDWPEHLLIAVVILLGIGVLVWAFLQ